jgi:ubiquinone biosynthesis protein UbiJ
MATQSPFSLLEGFFQSLSFPKLSSPPAPPVWAVDEAQRRLILLLNHILSQEKEATSRLARQRGRIVHMQWRSFSAELIATPAGLLDRAPNDVTPDLLLVLTEESPFSLAYAALRGDKPTVRIEGDVQLAAEVSWLVDHVRWDLEEDLSRLLGDVPAHALGQAVRVMLQALRQFIGTGNANVSGKAPT